MKSKFLAACMVAVLACMLFARPMQAQEPLVERVASLEKKIADMITMHAAIMAKLDRLSAKIDACSTTQMPTPRPLGRSAEECAPGQACGPQSSGGVNVNHGGNGRQRAIFRGRIAARRGGC